MRWKPVSYGFGVGWKSRRLTDAEQKPGSEEPSHTARDGRRKRSDAPQQGTDATDTPHAKLIEQNSRGKLADCIRPVIGAEQEPECDIRDTKFTNQRIMRNGEVDAIEIVDQHSQPKQECNGPAPSLCRLGHSLPFRSDTHPTIP